MQIQGQIMGGQAAQNGMMMQNQNYMKSGAGGINLQGGDQADITKHWDTNLKR